MATRRRYKARGGDVPPDVAAAPAAAPTVPVTDPIAESPLAAQIAAQQHAEELQRQHAQRQPPTVEEYIDRLPDLTAHKRAFLKQYPVMLNPSVMPLMARAYHEGLRIGLKDDSGELDEFILVNVERDLQHRQQL